MIFFSGQIMCFLSRLQKMQNDLIKKKGIIIYVLLIHLDILITILKNVLLIHLGMLITILKKIAKQFYHWDSKNT